MVEKEIRAIFLGDAGVGKTLLIAKLLKLGDKTGFTHGLELSMSKINIKGSDITIKVIEIAGAKFWNVPVERIIKTFIPTVIIFVVDLTREKTLLSILNYRELFESIAGVPIIIALNKSDLESKISALTFKNVLKDLGLESRIKHIRISAKTGERIENLLELIKDVSIEPKWPEKKVELTTVDLKNLFEIHEYLFRRRKMDYAMFFEEVCVAKSKNMREEIIETVRIIRAYAPKISILVPLDEKYLYIVFGKNGTFVVISELTRIVEMLNKIYMFYRRTAEKEEKPFLYLATREGMPVVGKNIPQERLTRVAITRSVIYSILSRAAIENKEPKCILMHSLNSMEIYGPLEENFCLGIRLPEIKPFSESLKFYEDLKSELLKNIEGPIIPATISKFFDSYYENVLKFLRA